jgi:phospholipid transport system substrate-binding protein
MKNLFSTLDTRCSSSWILDTGYSMLVENRESRIEHRVRAWSIGLAVGVFLIACHGVSAQSKDPNEPPKDPNELLRTKWDAVISVLRNKAIDPNEKAKRIDKIVTPIFDFPLMAKLALGRTHWPKLTPPQQKKFTRLFVERVKTSYREKVSLYTDEKVQFKPAVVKDKTICYIPMDLLSKDKKVNIVHKLRKVDKQWKVYDVEIQGVSILLTYRSQFDDILQKGTVEDLLARLEEPPAR